MSADNAEHMTDVSSREDNTNINSGIPADSASLKIEAIANSLVPKTLQGANERLPDKHLITKRYDEYDKEESDRDAGTQHQMVKDAGT